ncbi:MAG: PRC-barrel domain-containing protein [Gammaproteobacteria bacterium]
MKTFPTLLAASALGVTLSASTFATADVADQAENVRDEQQDVTEQRKDVREEQRDVVEARRDLRRDIAQIHRATNVIGTKVMNQSKEKLGEIGDLVLDFNTGGIAYVVITSGGVLGVGDTLHAVPWKALRLNAKMDAFVLNVTEAAWKNAPGFDPKNWPELAGQSWRQEIDSYYR